MGEHTSRQHRLATTAVHAGRSDLTALGVHAPPLDLSTTYPMPTLEGAAEHIDAWAHGEVPAGSPVYARLHNPTVARFEDAMATLEGTESAVGLASGMAAISAVLLALPEGRRHVVAIRPIYGGTDHLLTSSLLGTTATFTDVAGIAEAMTPDTGLVVVETPQNPTATLIDLAAVISAVDGRAPVMVDNTFATPVLQRPYLLGATLVVHSATKFIGGHGDAMGGVVACDEEWAQRLRGIRIATGGVLHPLAAYHLHRGVSTLAVRVRAMQQTATQLAARLLEHPAVARVHHPSLATTDPLGLVGRQMSGPGSMLAFELHDGFDAARGVLDSLQLMTHAVSLGSTDTLAQHPASLTHRIVSVEARDASGIGEGLIRISVGLEDIDDLWADLARALEDVGPQRDTIMVPGSTRPDATIQTA